MRIRGRGGIGLNRNGERSPGYVMDQVETDDPTVAAALAADGFLELGKSLRRMEGELLALAETKSSTASGATGKASMSAEKAARRYFRALRSIINGVENGTIVAPPMPSQEAHFGTASVDFAGGSAEVNLSDTVTGETWVTSTSVVIGTIYYNPLTSDPPSYFFQVATNDINVGDGFDFMVYNPGTPTGATYPIKWVGWA